MKFGKNHDSKQGLSYGIIGLGRFGSALATQLCLSGREVLVIDSDEDRVGAFREYTENAYVLRNLDKKTLAETGVQNCDVAVVCIGEKMDTSILTTLNLKSLGVPSVIAKANSAEHGEILAKLGAEVVYPERDMALRLAHRLEPTKILDYIELSEKVDISKVPLPREYVGKTVMDMDLRGHYGLNIIALEREGSIMTDITPAMVFESGDALFVMGDHERIKRFGQSD